MLIPEEISVLTPGGASWSRPVPGAARNSPDGVACDRLTGLRPVARRRRARLEARKAEQRASAREGALEQAC
jgi:hypothetical protein